MYHKCLSKYGYTILKDKISKEQEKKILADLTVKTTVLPAYKDFQKPKIYKIYYHNPTTYYLPRFYGIENFGQPEYSSLSLGHAIKDGLKCTREPLIHQKTALEKAKIIFDPSKVEGDGGVLSLPCGYGKTFCATKIVTDYLKLCALIIVPTECLMEQWMQAIKSFVPGARVGYIQRDHVEVDDKDFVIAMLHSIALKDYAPSTFDRFGIVIYDECHHVGSEQFCKSMLKIRTRFILGLSATPNRRDGLSHVFYKFMGPLFHKEKRVGSNIVYIKKLTLSSNSDNYQVLKMTNGTTNTAGMTTALCKCSERNNLIIFCIRNLIQQGRKILLLSSRREHLLNISNLLDVENIKRSNDGKAVTYGFYYGKKGMSRQEHKKLLDESSRCDIVLGIDTIAKEGLDIPDLNALIFSTPPGMDVEQPVGRILRKFHKDVNPLVIDLVDNTGNYQKHSKERDIWYRDEGYNIQNINIDLHTKWQTIVQGYLHKKEVLPATYASKASNASKASTSPNLSSCILDTPKAPPPKQTVIKRKNISELQLDICLVTAASSSSTVQKDNISPSFEKSLI